MWGFLKYPVDQNGGLCMQTWLASGMRTTAESLHIQPLALAEDENVPVPSGNVTELHHLLYILQHLPHQEPKWLFNNISLLALQEQWLMAKTIPVGRKEKSMIIPQEYWSAPGISQHSSVTITSNSLYSNKLFLSMKQSSVACFVSCLKSARKSSSGK